MQSSKSDLKLDKKTILTLVADASTQHCTHMHKGDMTPLTGDQMKRTIVLIIINNIIIVIIITENDWKHLG